VSTVRSAVAEFTDGVGLGGGADGAEVGVGCAQQSLTYVLSLCARGGQVVSEA
jgi:hypothetical protein